MKEDSSELRKIYGQMNDDSLLKIIHSKPGEYTNKAQNMAESILKERGVSEVDFGKSGNANPTQTAYDKNIKFKIIEGEKPHRPTYIKYGPWCTGSEEQLLIQFLKLKNANSINGINAGEIKKLFGKTKDEVVKGFLSGGLSILHYQVAMILIADKLKRKYGRLVEVRCLYDPQRIELIYESGHGFQILMHTGHPDISIIKFGYKGTGPDCFFSFLKENDFKISLKKIQTLKTPTVFYNDQIATDMDPSSLAAKTSNKLLCYQCNHFDDGIKVCSYFHFNVESSPKKFHKKCDGKYFSPKSK